MFDLRDLEGPAGRGTWAAAPDAVRAACGLLVSLVALSALRGWMVLVEWRSFQRAYGEGRGLDMSTAAGWAQAELNTPSEWSVLVDGVLVLLVVLAVLAVLARAGEARAVALVLAAFLAIDALAPLAYAVPWWFAVASAMLGGWALVLVVLMLRATTRMHVRPEPGSLHERRPRPGGGRPERQERRPGPF